MQKSRTKKWLVGLAIAGGIVVLLAIGGFLGWRALMNYFVGQYYQESYAPVALVAGSIGDYPAEYHLPDVPWISTEETLCQSNSLQMIAAQRGIEEPRRYFDFLMGFTYGASDTPGTSGIFPGTDPETGLVAAAPYLGLARRYYTTDDEELYLDALRYYLAQGYPVRLGLDYGLLYDADEALPHSDLLVGYDEDGFYYYETVCLPPAPCKPGHRPPGEKGLYVSEQRMLDAVLGQAEMLSYPWRYSLSIFEPGSLERDLGPIWIRNGQALIGGARYGPKQGTDAIEALASRIEGRGQRLALSEILPGLGLAAYVRRQNALYLREAFGGEPDMDRAASLFERAAGDYQQALDALGDGIADDVEAIQIGAWLRDATAAEREAGGIFLTRGQ